MKILRKFKNALENWWRCRTKTCDYYQHYLAYGPPELTHEGYHAACKKCEAYHRMFAAWLDSHDTGEPPESLSRICGEWEKRVRA